MTRSKYMIAGLALLAAGCSGGAGDDGLFGSDRDLDAAGSGTTGISSANLDPTTVAYFNQVIGDRVFFEVDQSNLTPGAMAVLDQQVAWLMQNSSAPVLIEGHADEQGTREYNIALSARRAAAVRNYMVTKGLSDSRLSTIPYGKERPIEICSEERCWSQNRRAVTVVTGAAGV